MIEHDVYFRKDLKRKLINYNLVYVYKYINYGDTVKCLYCNVIL